MFGEYLTMGQASIVALFSITVVFLVLLLISYMIQLIAAIIAKMQKPKEAPAVKSAPAAEEPAVEEEPADDSHMDAVIPAAVACCLGKEPGSFVVKSITPLNTESDWSRVSRTSALH